jgi:hypothetical protein
MNKKPLYYKQSDPKWGNIPYTIDGDKKETIGASGCGPTCAAMIIASVKDSKITPVEMCSLAIDLKDRTANDGTEWEFFGKVAARYNIPFKQSGSTKEAIEALEEGAYVICNMKPGKFTKSGHYILAWDYSDNNIIVHDSASTAYERTYGDIRTFETQCRQYFIFFVKQQLEEPKLPVLKRGAKNQHVKKLQELLNKAGYKLVVDGDFGAITEGAVRDFQRTRGLVVDGIVGPKTWNKLYEA